MSVGRRADVLKSLGIVALVLATPAAAFAASSEADFKAAYAAGSTPSFTADSTVAGKYTLEAASAGT